ncbi:MAG: aldo/keto reductase [Ilumatobacteraceae bacterium]
MQLGLGCVNLGTVSGGQGWRADVRLVETAIDQGIRILDTADAYGNGGSERVVGQAIRGRRDEVVVATKGGYVFRERSRAEVTARRIVKTTRDRVRSSGPTDGDGAAVGAGSYAAHDFSTTAMRSALDASLRRLGTDHVDVYQLHGPDEVMPDLIADLRGLVIAGKVRRLGVGCESIAAAAAWSEVAGVDVVQMPLGVLDPDAVETARAAARRGVEVWARGVFAGGVLTAARRDPAYVQRDPKGPLINQLQALADERGIDLFALALGFARSIPEVSTVLLGMSRPEHIERNLALAAAPELAPDVLAELHVILDGWTPGAA